MIVTTAVDAARNANNKVVGQKIGRDNYKINNLEWPYLDAETWSSMLQEFDKHFFSSVQFWDMVNNCWRTLTMYPGDRSADVLRKYLCNARNPEQRSKIHAQSVCSEKNTFSSNSYRMLFRGQSERCITLEC